MDRKTYPPEWEEFSLRIRTEVAQGRCQCEGECKRGHKGRCEAKQGDPCVTNKQHKVVLTVAHLDYKGGPCRCKAETGLKCAIEAHCKAMCQACHLIMDLPHHVANARRTRAAKAGQMWLGDIESR